MTTSMGISTSTSKLNHTHGIVDHLHLYHGHVVVGGQFLLAEKRQMLFCEFLATTHI